MYKWPTEQVVERGRAICQSEGFYGRIPLLSLRNGPPDGGGGPHLARGRVVLRGGQGRRPLVRGRPVLVPAGGAIAFTDWVEGAAGRLSSRGRTTAAATRRFPIILAVGDYRDLLVEAGFRVFSPTTRADSPRISVSTGTS